MFGSPVYTKHAKRRGKSRGISSLKSSRASRGSKHYLGQNKYKATANGVTTVYKLKGRKKIILTTWKER